MNNIITPTPRARKVLRVAHLKASKVALRPYIFGNSLIPFHKSILCYAISSYSWKPKDENIVLILNSSMEGDWNRSLALLFLASKFQPLEVFKHQSSNASNCSHIVRRQNSPLLHGSKKSRNFALLSVFGRRPSNSSVIISMVIRQSLHWGNHVTNPAKL